MKIINRHISKTIYRLSKEFPALLLAGARQTGKTTVLHQHILDKGIGEITFDDPSEEQSAKSDPKAFMRLHQPPVLFDEVQYVPDIFRYLKLEIDKQRHPGNSRGVCVGMLSEIRWQRKNI